MKSIKIKWNKKDEKKPCDVYVLFNGRITELIGHENIIWKLKILILNFWIWFNISITVSLRKVIKESWTSLN